MKMFLKIIVIALVPAGCLIIKPERITNSVTIMGKLDTNSLDFSNGKYYSARINLKNNSNNTLDYWTMSCSWQSNLVSSKKSIQLFVDCPKNIPQVIQIKPFGTVSHFGIIELVDSTDFQDLKLGFVLVKKNEVFDETDFIKILRNKIEADKDIYWSNSFDIKP